VALMRESGPLISVLLPVYNGAPYLAEAIESILCQSYGNFELIIVNDGSNDGSAAIMSKYNDVRIRAYHQGNKGLAATLNRAITLSNGDYLARQDQDDVSFPNRFKKQISFLEANRQYGMVGTWASIWVGDKETNRAHRHPSENFDLQFDLLFNNPFVHSSVMIRKTVFKEVALYSTDKNRQPPEDYELWSRIARKFKVANIPEFLLIYREVPQSMSRTGVNPFLDRVINISAENLAFANGIEGMDQKTIDIASLVHGSYHRYSSTTSFQELRRLLVNAAHHIAKSGGVSSETLAQRAENYFYSIKHSYLSYKYGSLYTVIQKIKHLPMRIAGRLLP